MKFCTLLLVVWMACSVTDALKCNLGMGDNYKETECAGIIEACSKVDYGNGTVVRSCGIKGMEGCTELEGGSICFCTTDLCNTGTSNTRTSTTFHYLMVTLAMIVASSCMKSTFLWE